MTPVERIARLVGLLDRVQKNAAAPRPAAGTPAPARVAPAPVAKSSPIAAPAPAAKSSPVAAPPAAKSSPFAAPPPVAAAPAPVAAPPPVAPAPSPSPAPPPVAAAPAYPSAPPGLGLDAPGQEPDSVPPPPTAPPPQPALSSWPSEPASAVQARPSESPEELGEDDLVEMTTLPPAPTAEERAADPDLAVSVSSSAEVEISVEEEEIDQPPASSRRPKLTEESDVIAETALDDEREVPVKTPPPESGPQEAALPMGGALADGRLPDVDGLEADMLGPPSMGPTAEQLGETIELEAPRGPDLEIDVASAVEPPPPPPEAPAEELEVALPRAPMLSGTFDVGASIPPIDISTKVDPHLTVPAARTIQESPTSVEIRGASADVTMRPTHGATDVARVTLAQPPASKVFTDILDQSLGL